MPDVSVFAATALAVSLNLYAVFGGADYGGGMWTLLAFGPRSERQRDTIARVLAPVWEANHVWLVLAVVILFTAFPFAFAVLGTALHVPLTLLLFGIVLRGAAFVFRAYGGAGGRPDRSWEQLFAVASSVTPLVIGMVVGAVTEGNIRVVSGKVQAGLLDVWTTPFCFLVGFFALALFAFLAAAFLTLEANSPALANDFRRRALVSGGCVASLALAVFWASNAGIRTGLTRSFWALPLHLATGACALMAFVFLYTSAFRWARVAAAAQVSCIVWGWVLAQYPFLIRPDVTVQSAAAPAATLRLLVALLCLGALVLFPALGYLYSVFDPAERKTPDAERLVRLK
jgi:cytochrome bd ubiquinol oxidase subunit II